ncbi:MAG: GAF domain-containing protein [Oscillospiraceae bacterium]|nr:GAF domain-containing protein [Oscillospiraceae bacterium]
MTDYDTLVKEAEALVSGVPHLVANLANLSALIYNSLEDINWAGFYLANGDKLVLGPFQGKTACIEIPFGKGVCGTAAAQNKTICVDDVHEFEGHIACDAASRSEIVIPLRKNGRVVAVLDIDSPVCARFDDNDRHGLTRLAKTAEKMLVSFL